MPDNVNPFLAEAPLIMCSKEYTGKDFVSK